MKKVQRNAAPLVASGKCLKFESEEDDAKLMVAPRRRWGDNQEE